MWKILGGVFVALASWLCGCGARQNLKMRIRMLKELQLAMERMRNEMELNMPPLPELFRMAGEDTAGLLSAFFRGTAEKMEEVTGRPPHIAMKIQMEETELDFGREGETMLLELGNALGRYDLTGQARTLEIFQRRTQTLLTDAEYRLRHEAKTWSTAALCTGLALIIILL